MRSLQWVSSLKTASTAAVNLPAQPTLANHECLTTRSARVFAGGRMPCRFLCVPARGAGRDATRGNAWGVVTSLQRQQTDRVPQCQYMHDNISGLPSLQPHSPGFDWGPQECWLF